MMRHNLNNNGLDLLRRNTLENRLRCQDLLSRLVDYEQKPTFVSPSMPISMDRARLSDSLARFFNSRPLLALAAGMVGGLLLDVILDSRPKTVGGRVLSANQDTNKFKSRIERSMPGVWESLRGFAVPIAVAFVQRTYETMNSDSVRRQ